MAKRLFLGAMALLLASVAPASGCAGRLEGAAKTTTADYDPFSVIERHERYVITIRNTGPESCGFAVGFERASGAAQLGGILPFSLHDANGHEILSDTKRRRTTVPSHIISPGGTATIAVDVTVPRGHFATPGNYQAVVTMALFAVGGWETRRTAIDQQPLVIDRQVAPCFSMNIAGAGLATTVDFGQLVDGEERSVILQIRANQNYRLSFASQNGGHLALDPPIASEAWNIDYSVRVDGVPTLLAPSATVPEELSPNGQQSHKLIFRIGSAANKRAGLYRDVITINVGAKT